MKKLLLIIALLLSAAKTYAIEEILPDIEEKKDEAPIVFSLEAIKESDYLLGDLFGAREALKEKGIDIQSSYIIDSFLMSNRETKSKKGTYQGLFNASIEFDTEKMNLYKGGKLYLLYQAANTGVNSMNFLNSFSDINSYDPMRSINQISELYYEHSFKDDLFNLKVGKQDANMDFQALDTGFNFLNLSFSFIPNTPMPLFPSQQMGARARLKLKNDFYIQNGFYDGNLDIGSNPKSFFTGKNKYFDIIEGYKLTNFDGKEGKYFLGGWIKTNKNYDFETNELKRNNFGGYLGFEQKITEKYEDGSGGANIFGQFGYAREGINDVPYYGGIGAVYKGIGKKRKEDSIGLAFNWHQFDKTLKHLENKTAEKVVEVFYKIKVTNFLYIQPDIQYIIKPDGTDKNALAFGVRTYISF